MKIALLGYGKMGKAIEKIALQRGHEIVLRVSDTQVYEISKQMLLLTLVFQKLPLITSPTALEIRFL